MNLLHSTIVYYCTLLYSAFSHKDPPCMLIQIHVHVFVCVCVCVCARVRWMCMHMCACVLAYIIMCGSYNTQNGMKPIGGLLYELRCKITSHAVSQLYSNEFVLERSNIFLALILILHTSPW